MQKTRGPNVGQEELQKKFKECVTDQVKPSNGLMGALKNIADTVKYKLSKTVFKTCVREE